MNVRLKWETTVVRVEEKTLTVGGRKSVDGKAELFHESQGWYITLVSGVSIFAGLDKPDFEAGDRIEITLQKKESDLGSNQEIKN